MAKRKIFRFTAATRNIIIYQFIDIIIRGNFVGSYQVCSSVNRAN